MRTRKIVAGASGLVVLALFAAVAVQACGGQPETSGAATPVAPAVQPIVPVATPTAPSPVATLTGPPPAAPQPPTAASLTDEEVLAQVDEMLSTGVLPPLDLSQSLLSDSATPVLWADAPPGDLGSFNANLDFEFSVPPVNIQAPKVSPGR